MLVVAVGLARLFVVAGNGCRDYGSSDLSRFSGFTSAFHDVSLLRTVACFRRQRLSAVMGEGSKARIATT
jgi:hypothetical protein